MFNFQFFKKSRPALAEEIDPVWPTPSPEQLALRHARDVARFEFLEDTREARKDAWLRSIKPRIRKGTSGFWWCSSQHSSPDRTRPTQKWRVGSGRTPREAYDAWKAY